MGGTGSVRDLLLSEPELEASLAQMGGDRIGPTELTDQRVLIAGIAIRAASPSPARCRPLNGLSDGAVSAVAHRQVELIKMDKLRSRCSGLVLEAGDGDMGRISGGGRLLLTEAELEASLAPIGGDWIGLTEFADLGVFVAGVAIGAASSSAAGCGPLNGLSDRAVEVAFHRGMELIKSDKFRQGTAAGRRSSPLVARDTRQRKGARAAERSPSP